jgi:TetR/AcrR family transcriptional regulator, transcriptional repressor for nem operon
MLVNTVLELAGVDDDLSAQASRLLERMQSQFESCLLDAGLAPKLANDFASFLMLFNEGIRVSSRRKVPADQQMADINTTFRLLQNAAS